MFFSNFKGVKKAPDPNHPIDRRPYKGPQPYCHDINMMTRKKDMLEILIGFTGGQIQLIDPLKHEYMKCFNEERTIEKGIVTCIRWVPGTEGMFLASYSTGIVYIYNKEHPLCTPEPVYNTLKRGKGYVIECCKSKTPCNPVFRWVIGQGSINDMTFSPDCKHIAILSEDGYLRVFNYEKQELVGLMRSYFGGLLSASWSPDGKYIVTGGEDDIVTVWSFLEQRVIARGQGHRSWVNVVSFDPYTTNIDGGTIDDSDEEDMEKGTLRHRASTFRDHSFDHHQKPIISYRFGSVGDDTQLLLWDISEDILRPQRIRTRSMRTSTLNQISQPQWTYANNSSTSRHQPELKNSHDNQQESSSHVCKSNLPVLPSQPKSSIKKHSTSITSKHHNSVSNYSPKGVTIDEEELVLGTSICPRLEDVPVLEPLVAKKISQDRLCALVFREDCLVTATNDGYIHVWARPDSLISKQDSSTVIQ